METHDHAGLELALLVGRLVFAVGMADQGEDQPIHAGAGFNHVGNVVAIGEPVGIFARLFRRSLGRDSRPGKVLQPRVMVTLPQFLSFRVLEFRPGGLQLVVENTHGFAGKPLML